MIRRCSRRLFSTSARSLRKIKTLTEVDAKADFASRNNRIFATPQLCDEQYPLLKVVKHTQALDVRIPEFIEIWNEVHEFTSEQAKTPVVIRGRITSIRKAGKSLVFLDIIQDFEKLQVVLNKNKLDLTETEFFKIHNDLRRGDIIQAVGIPWRTAAGQLSVLSTRGINLLSPCLHPTPESSRLSDTTKLHNRVVDLLTSSRAKSVIQARGTILREIRKFFESRNYLEVQTPMLSTHASGAVAEPFKTTSRALSHEEQDAELSLRIAPELWLKRLTIAGFDKVFEIGQCFRNEGIDATHNPEFTTCEFYKSYTDLDELVAITETLLTSVARAIIKQFPQFSQNASILTEAPFQRLDFISTIENATKLQLPDRLTDASAIYDYVLKCDTSLVGDSPKSTYTASKLLDILAGKYIEPLCSTPTFIMNHPSAMSPLSKSDTVDINGKPRHVARRLELFIGGREYVNAYEEENSPFAQRQKFEIQAQNHRQDSEEPLPDYSYVSAMEWGLPPTGGWGLGIDRLCMLLTGSDRIAQVLTFGGVKAVNMQ